MLICRVHLSVDRAVSPGVMANQLALFHGIGISLAIEPFNQERSKTFAWAARFNCRHLAAQWYSGTVAQRHSGTVRQFSTFNKDNPSLNPALPFQTADKFFTLHCFNSHCCTNEYLAIDSGGYLCTNSLRASVAAWLDDSQRSRCGVLLNRLQDSHGLNCRAL